MEQHLGVGLGQAAVACHLFHRVHVKIPADKDIPCLLILLLPLQSPMLREIKSESSVEGDFIYSNQEAPENAGHYGGTGDVMAAATESFRAEVLEVGSGWILVKPLEGEPELRSADKITVSLRSVQSVPTIKPGDRVEITYSGSIQETYPAQISDATWIVVIQ